MRMICPACGEPMEEGQAAVRSGASLSFSRGGQSALMFATDDGQDFTILDRGVDTPSFICTKCRGVFIPSGRETRLRVVDGKCPTCERAVDAQAPVCRHCGQQLDPEGAEETAAKQRGGERPGARTDARGGERAEAEAAGGAGEESDDSTARYDVRLMPDETKALAKLIGQTLESVTTDGWAVQLDCGDSALGIIPQEIATPDAHNPEGAVERPLVRTDGESGLDDEATVVAEDLGRIQEIRVISILISFTQLSSDPSGNVPPGLVGAPVRAFGWRFHGPTQRGRAEREAGDGALVDLDIAIELVTEHCPSLVIYTTGYEVQASARGVPDDEEWARAELHTRRPVKAGQRGVA